MSKEILLFDKELHSILESRPPVSASKIGSLVKIAIKYGKLNQAIVECVEKFVKKCAPEYKLSGLYVIDAIVKSAVKYGGDATAYGSVFELKLNDLFSQISLGNEKDRVK